MKDSNVFTYGTLMIPEVMKAVTEKEFVSCEARLENYRRYQVKNKIYPAIIASQESSTEGIIYLGVDSESLQRLDYFEDVIYSRTEVVVDCCNDQKDAFAYVINSKYETLLSNKEWDIEEFRTRCLETYIRRSRHWMIDYPSN